MSKSEKILLCICLLLSSVIISYNLFFIPLLPNSNVVKKEFVFKEPEKEEKNKNKININLSDEDNLMQIPGVGRAIAKRIIEYREQNGGFSSISEITNVKGIGTTKFNSIKDYICI